VSQEQNNESPTPPPYTYPTLFDDDPTFVWIIATEHRFVNIFHKYPYLVVLQLCCRNAYPFATHNFSL
jgi:hypothetical protein